MCEANVFLSNGEQEELFLEQVDLIEPDEEGLRLVDIFGKQKFIKAKIRDMNFLTTESFWRNYRKSLLISR